MEQILDHDLNYDSAKDVRYGSFWPRCWASLLDGIMVGLIQVLLVIINFTYLKSPWIIILLTLLMLSYKPFMEYMYQATIGKKLLGLKVVNNQFQKASLTAIILRDSLKLTAGLLSLALTVPLLFQDNFAKINSFLEYLAYIGTEKSAQYVNYLPLLIAIIDVICLVTDFQKRTFHDRIGKTFVIKG
jgi:uncharacterized RDD family membrane protein YckC